MKNKRIFTLFLAFTMILSVLTGTTFGASDNRGILLNEGKIAMQGSIDEIRRIQRQEEFTVELLEAKSTQILQNAFSDVQRVSEDTLVFRGGEARMFELLGFISENRIALQKIERSGSSLESLFMEVVGK